MKQNEKLKSFHREVWVAARRDLAFGLPWIPIYSLAELGFALSVSALIQLIFVETPRVTVAALVPSRVQNAFQFGQTLDRKDLAFIIPLVIVIIGFVRLFSGFLSSYFIERAGHRVAHRVRWGLLAGFLNAKGNLIDAIDASKASTQLLMDSTLLQSSISRGTVSAVRDGFVLLTALGAIIIMAFKTTFIAFFVIVPVALILRAITKKMNYYARESANKQVLLATHMLQMRHNLLGIAAERTQFFEYQNFKKRVDAFYAFIRKSFMLRTSFRPITELIVMFLLAILVHWKINQDEAVAVSTYSTIFILVAFSFRPLKNLASLLSQWSEISVVWRRLSNLWQSFHASQHSEQRIFVDDSSRFALEVKQLCYDVEVADSGCKRLLHNCNVQVNRGTRVAFVGESGAGKTTFLRLIAGLLVAAEGEIKLEKNAILATQYPYVFKGTLKENLVYFSQLTQGNGNDELYDILKALALAHSAGGCSLLLQKHVGYLGEGLSGGERARVSLGRALLRKPHLLLLDEPTANLDSESAGYFWQAVEKWRKSDANNTVIAVSHALHEVRDWDFCYVFKDGRIVSSGIPQEILKQ